MRVDRRPSSKLHLVHINLEIDELYRHYHHWMKFGALTNLERYVLILEDRRFFSHSGVDIISVMRELLKACMLRKHGGASTIDMQFVRTINNRRELTSRRKLREMLVAYLANYHFNKIAMLRSYLSIAFFGSGLIGCEKASMAIFGKNATELNDLEAANLAAMLVYPRPSTPNPQWAQRVSYRANYALKIAPRFKKRFQQVPVSE